MNKFDFNDILIKPAMVSNIESRKDINPFYNGFLPLITAPMDTVIDIPTTEQYSNLKITPCLPRGEQWVGGKVFSSYSLTEIDDIIKKTNNPIFSKRNGYYLIDVANGHMAKMVSLVKEFKRLYPYSKLMVGNIANPETYIELSEAGADYIRVGIGNGGGCFVGDTKIITIDGLKKISDIVIGDKVLTHNGKYEEVYNTISYSVSDPLIKINETMSTKNHEYYVLNKKHLELINDDNIHDYAEWVKAEHLTTEFLILQNI
jgi:hypothetical protein